jgi:hypothetical protein
MEWWERQQARRQKRAQVQHLRASRVAHLRAFTSWIALGLVVVLVLATQTGAAVAGAYLKVALLLLLWVVVARTRTISWRFTSYTFCVAVGWAVLAGAATTIVTPWLAEASLLLAPLALAAIVMPGRLGRFSVIDWLLLGCTTGLGYQATSASAWAIAGSRSGVAPDVAPASAAPYLVLALAGVCTGIAIAAGRSGSAQSGRARLPGLITGVLLPVLAFSLVIGAQLPAQGQLNLALRPLRALGSNQQLILVLLLVLIVAGLMIDTRRIRTTDEPGTDRLPFPYAPAGAADRWTLAITGPGSPGPPSAFFYALTALVWAACCCVTYVVRDVLVVFGAHLRDPGEQPDQARERGRAAAVFTRVLRAEALRPLDSADLDSAGRGRQLTRSAGVVVLAVLLGAGLLLATVGPSAPGAWLGQARGALLGGSAPAGGSAIWAGLTLLAALLLLTAGAPGLALSDDGVRRLLLDRGRGAVRFTRPGSWGQRIASSTVLELLLDALTTLVTLIPPVIARPFVGSASSGPARAAVAEFCADPARLIARRRRQLSAAPDDTGALLAVRTGSWDAASRRRWVDSRISSRAYRITSADGRTSIPSDGLSLAPDGVAMVEAIHLHPAGAPLLYEGQAPPMLAERLLAPFDDEMRRYATVLRDPHNPVSRLRLVVASQLAGNLLGRRAREILGHDLDLLIVVDPLGG